MLCGPIDISRDEIFSEEALRDLTASIRQHGILQPIVVRPDPDRPGRFEIIAGERRWRAAQAQLHQVPVVVTVLDNRGALEVALIENIQRQDLNALKRRRLSPAWMTEFSHTQEKIGRGRRKEPQSHCQNTLRLLALPETVKGVIFVQVSYLRDMPGR